MLYKIDQIRCHISLDSDGPPKICRALGALQGKLVGPAIGECGGQSSQTIAETSSGRPQYAAYVWLLKPFCGPSPVPRDLGDCYERGAFRRRGSVWGYRGRFLSDRNKPAVFGATDTARRAGIDAANSPTSDIVTTTPAKTRGSRGVA